MNPYYTHRRVLVDELSKLNYDHPVHCLEFGVGRGSSPIFRRFLMDNKNMIVDAYDNDEKWFVNMSREYAAPNYRFHYISSWDDLFSSDICRGTYDLVFVDQAPWVARTQTIDVLRNCVKVFVLHDYCYYNTGVVDDVFRVDEGSFFHVNFASDFILDAKRELYPPTLVLRNKNQMNIK